jgi:flavin reductase (DIM6/NTAB) family NADH-FMN oxidoreductase RutF
MAKRQLKAGALLAPVPAVLVSVGDENEQNVFTVAWCGTVCTQPPKTYISVRPSRHSYEIIKRTGEFVINLVPTSLAKSADYCGIYTGAKVDKFEKCRFTPEACEGVSAPAIAECPVSIGCKVTDMIPLGSHDMFIADVLSVSASEELFDKDGALHMEKADLTAYVHGAYFALGKQIGKFGYSAARKKKKGKGAGKPAKKNGEGKN